MISGRSIALCGAFQRSERATARMTDGRRRDTIVAALQ
jgi:hypothetical protein